MRKRKFEQELERSMGMESFSIAHGVSERQLKKAHKLPLPPKIGPRPIIHMKLSWAEIPEVDVKVMLDPGANVTVISQELVEKHKVPVVIRERAEIISGYDGVESKGAGSAYTFACTLRLEDHYTKESFEVSPLQDDHDIILPWWWTLKHPIPYLSTGVLSDIKFNSTKCTNCTKAAITEFSIEYDDTVAYFDREQKWVGVIGTLRMNDEGEMDIEMPKEIPWQYRDYKSVYNG